MIRRPPRSTRTDTLFPYTTLFRSDRAHILLGLVVAVSNLDEVVRIIRGSNSPTAAREALLLREWPIGEIAPYIRLVEAIEGEMEDSATYRLSEIQVKAILDLSLHRLTAPGRDEKIGSASCREGVYQYG